MVYRKQAKRDDDLESNLSDLEYQGETEDVYRLPPPEPLPYDEYGNLIRIRVPPPLPREGDDFDINYVGINTIIHHHILDLKPEAFSFVMYD